MRCSTASCDSAALITVLDILLGSFTGGGSLTVNIGGAQAQLWPTPRASAASGPPGSGRRPRSRPAPGRPAAPGSPARGPAAPAVGSARHRRRPISPRARWPPPTSGTESDGALAVGLLALALGAVLVEADRRKMRQAGDRAVAPIPSGGSRRMTTPGRTRDPITIWHRLLRGLRALPAPRRARARHGRVRARRGCPTCTDHERRRCERRASGRAPAAGPPGTGGADRRRHGRAAARSGGAAAGPAALAAGVQRCTRPGRADPRRPLLARRASRSPATTAAPPTRG